MVKSTDTAKNSKTWRDKKRAEGYCFENLMLKSETLTAIEKIAEDFGCDKHTAVDKVIEKFVNSADYQKEITIEQLDGFEKRIEGFNEDLKGFMQTYFRQNYTEEEIEAMKEFLKVKPLTKSLNYGKFKKNNSGVIKLKSYKDYKFFVKAFDLSTSDE